MLRATNRYAGDGITTSFTITFVDGYRKREDVRAYIEDKATKVRTPVTLTFLTDFQVTVPTAPTVDETLVIYRATPDAALVDFTQTQRLSEATLNTATRQAIFKANEAMDASDQTEKEELLAAIDTVMSRVDDASTEADRAEAAANQASGFKDDAETARDSASGYSTDAQGYAYSASGYATAASTAKGQAEYARDGAQGYATAAFGSASSAISSAGTASTASEAAQGYASAASVSASAASDSASSASSSAGNASTSASNAQTSANNAAQSASDALAAVVVEQKSATCYNYYLMHVGGGVIHMLPRNGGKLVINGNVGTISTASPPSVSLSNSIYYNLYAYVSGGAVGMSFSTTAPIWSSAGYYIMTDNPSYMLVGGVYGAKMIFDVGAGLRHAYMGTSTTSVPIIQYNGTWNGSTVTLATLSCVLMPGDMLDIYAQLNLMTTPANRGGDCSIIFSSAVMSTTRHTHNAASDWRSYSPRWSAMRSRDDPSGYYSFLVKYTATSSSGGSWSTLGSPDAMCLIASQSPLVR